MRIDYAFLAEVLNVFLDAEEPTVDWRAFARFHADDAIAKKLVFHLELLWDRNLATSDRQDGALGIRRSGDGSYGVSIVPWRLTADGHDFAASLSKPSVLKVILAKFGREGLEVTKNVAIELAKQQAAGLLGG